MDPSDALAMQVTSLRKVYGGMVTVDEVSFEVERGIIFGIIGPNGAGKTTAIECLEGLRHPDGGSVFVTGLDLIAERPRFVHKIGVQLQDVGIPPPLKAWVRGATLVRRALRDVDSPVGVVRRRRLQKSREMGGRPGLALSLQALSGRT